MTDHTHGQDGPGDTLRAAQIAAVRDVMGWGDQPDAWNEEQVANCAAELVDAVNLVRERHRLIDNAALDDHDSFAGEAMRDPEIRRAYRDQAHTAGYAAAVANLRDDAGYDAWVRTQPHSWTRADYLEAIGPGAAPAQPEPTWRVGRHLGRTLYHHGQVVGMVDSPELAARIVEALSAPESGRERPTHTDLPDEGRTGRGGETAGQP